MPKFAKSYWAKLVVQWKKASFWEKFILINIAYPWALTLTLLAGKYGDVIVAKIQTTPGGPELYQVAGDAFAIAGYFLGQALGI